jgi:RNA recognition motif-containing protein
MSAPVPAAAPAAQVAEPEYTPVPGASLFIGNLSFTSTEETLNDVFSKFGGSIIKVTIPGSDRRKLGYGTLCYARPRRAANDELT